MPKTEKSSVQKHSLKMVFVSLCALILVLCGIILYLLLSPRFQDHNTEKNVVTTPGIAAKMRPLLTEEPNPDSAYTVSMNLDWYFENADAPSSNSYIENLPENSRTVYITVSLTDTGEIIYTSPDIPVGSELSKIALQTELQTGDYSATCVYHLVDEAHVEITTASVEVKLHILH